MAQERNRAMGLMSAEEVCVARGAAAAMVGAGWEMADCRHGGLMRRGYSINVSGICLHVIFRSRTGLHLGGDGPVYVKGTLGKPSPTRLEA